MMFSYVFILLFVLLAIVLFYHLHCVSKNDADVAHYNFNTHQPMLVICGSNVAKRVCYRMMICYPTSPN